MIRDQRLFKVLNFAYAILHPAAYFGVLACSVAALIYYKYSILLLCLVATFFVVDWIMWEVLSRLAARVYGRQVQTNFGSRAD
jgi:hypothetical protein